MCVWGGQRILFLISLRASQLKSLLQLPQASCVSTTIMGCVRGSHPPSRWNQCSSCYISLKAYRSPFIEWQNQIRRKLLNKTYLWDKQCRLLKARLNLRKIQTFLEDPSRVNHVYMSVFYTNICIFKITWCFLCSSLAWMKKQNQYEGEGRIHTFIWWCWSLSLSWTYKLLQ